MLESLYKELESCQIADWFRLRKQYNVLVKHASANQLDDSRVAALAVQIKESQKKCAARNSAIPAQIHFPEELPVSGKADEIGIMLKQNQVLVVAGDTGSGKTTQIPKMCLAAGYGRKGLIGHTQPRRLAAVSVADRIAQELKVQTGQGVGYQVRFNEQTNPTTFLKLMTDGILLAEIQQDKFLNRYEVIIIDEAHERSLNIDFLLGFLKQLLPKRPDLKLIITSATIDLEKFSSHFNDAPIISVSGRTYPVVTQYQPPVELSKDKDSAGSMDLLLDSVVAAVESLYAKGKGLAHDHNDVLVFFSSEREIREAATAFRKRKLPHTEILPLYARLRHSEQVKIFQPHTGNRVVLATNVAETSITVPGIRYVVDTGLARISRYSLQSKVQRLPIEAISQASANQRQGRCGRVAEGVCIRLYSEADFNSRPMYTDPEIRRTNLASVILRMRYLRLGDVGNFPFLEAPDNKAINEGFKLLFELNALTPSRELTPYGKSMARLPVDPRYGRMLVVAQSQGCLSELLIIVSALSIQDPRESGGDNRAVAIEKLQRYNHPDSDFLSLVNLWNAYEEERQRLNQSQLRKYCKQNCLSYMRMREWREVHRQLLLSCQQLGWKINKTPADYQSVHKSIISGSLNQIACKSEGNQYLGNRNRKFKLLSSSVLSKGQVDWIVTGDLVETHQVFASMAAKINPQWVEQMALHLVKREYFEPHWSKKRQQVMAYEKVHLYGLTLLEKSLISFADIDGIAAREIFIRDGVVGRQLRSKLPFYQANLDYLDQLAKQEDKIRRPDFIVSESDVVRFYDERFPASVVSTRSLESWANPKSKGRHARNDTNDSNADGGKVGDLLLEKSDFMAAYDESAALAQFPDQTSVNQNNLDINYVFDPSNHRDGATIDVPLVLLGQMTQADIDWAVPGIIRDRCITLLKGLPKATRKNFIPISSFVDLAMEQMSPTDGSLLDALLVQIRVLKKINLKVGDFSAVEVPVHLQTKIRIVDEAGREVGIGSDIGLLKREHLKEMDITLSAQARAPELHAIECSGLHDWTFDEIPQQLELGANSGLVLVRFPALIDEGESVGIKLYADETEAQRVNQEGLARLLMLRSIQQRNTIRKTGSRFLDSLALKMKGTSIISIDELLQATYREAFDLSVENPRDKSEFESLLTGGKAKLIPVAEKIQNLIMTIVDRKFEIEKLVQSTPTQGIEYAISDINSQLSKLLCEGFLRNTETQWLSEFPRYLNAVELRLAKAPHLGAKDKDMTEQLQVLWRRYDELKSSLETKSEEQLQQLRWMLEEFRVSLFAQNLGTKLPVSVKRLDKQFELLRNL